MSLLSPLALLVGALSIPLVLLYFLKVRRREATVPSLLLWDPALRDREASTFFQRLQRDPLLILQLLALLALAFAHRHASQCMVPPVLQARDLSPTLTTDC